MGRENERDARGVSQSLCNAIKGQGFALVTLKTRKSNVEHDFFHSERSKGLEDTKQQRAWN